MTERLSTAAVVVRSIEKGSDIYNRMLLQWAVYTFENKPVVPVEFKQFLWNNGYLVKNEHGYFVEDQCPREKHL